MKVTAKEVKFMYCIKCGRKLKKEETVCERCGKVRVYDGDETEPGKETDEISADNGSDERVEENTEDDYDEYEDDDYDDEYEDEEDDYDDGYDDEAYRRKIEEREREAQRNAEAASQRPKKLEMALLLAVISVLGGAGAHRFYLGHFMVGLVYLGLFVLSILTGLYLHIVIVVWSLIDLVLILFNRLTPADGSEYTWRGNTRK